MRAIEKHIHYPWEDIRRYSYFLAKESHRGQKRNSGEDYFSKHSVAVADIITNYFYGQDKKCLDRNSIKLSEALAYLHDVVEDTSINREEIEQKFGHDVAHIIDALTEDIFLRSGLEKELADGFLSKKEMKIILLRDSLEKINNLKKSGEDKNYKIAGVIRIADIIQNLEDFKTQDYSLLERNLEKAKIIYEEFKDSIPFASVLKKKIENIYSSLQEYAS